MNLKYQLDNILKNYGHKAIYRRYNTGVKSEYYDAVTKEGVGGAKWTYTDQVVLCRYSPTSTQGSQGVYDGGPVYYLKAHIKPKVNDVVLEVILDPNNSSTDTARVRGAEVRHAMKITDIDPKRGADGAIVFYQCYVEPEYGNV